MTCRLSTALLTGKPFPLVVLLHLDSVWDRLLKLHCENESLDLVGKQTERSSKGLPWVSQSFWPIPPRCSHVFRSRGNKQQWSRLPAWGVWAVLHLISFWGSFSTAKTKATFTSCYPISSHSGLLENSSMMTLRLGSALESSEMLPVTHQ